MRVYYSPEYVVSAHSFDTTRKSRWIADELMSRPLDGVTLTPPRPLDIEDILRVHDGEYVHAVRTGKPSHLAESQGFVWDSRMWDMAVHVNGGVLDASRAALTDGVSGSLSSGLHHAKHGYGSGYCTFNGLVVSARRLLEEGLVGSVLVLDLDAHCGGGTASLIRGDSRIAQLDVSVSQFDRYSGVPNARLRMVWEANRYLDAVADALAVCERTFDLVLYNAGMDPYAGCDIGGIPGMYKAHLEERERMVFHWCRERGMPVAFVLAGGYTGAALSEIELVELHMLTVKAALSAKI